MDTQKLISQAKARFKHQEAKIYLQEKYFPRLSLANQGGMWQITTDFLSFLKSCKDAELIILDSFKKPIKIKRKLLLEEAEKTYKEVMEEWYLEYTELQKNR